MWRSKSPPVGLSLLLLAFAVALIAIALITEVSADAEAAKHQEIKKRFIPFAKEKAAQRESEKVEQGSIINVPTKCPSNMLKVNNRCRTVY